MILGSEKGKAMEKKQHVLEPTARLFDLEYDAYHPGPGGSPPERAFKLFASGFDLLVELLTEPDSFPSLDKGLSRRTTKVVRKNLLWGGGGSSLVLAHAIPVLFARMNGSVAGEDPGMRLSGEQHRHLRNVLSDFYPLQWKKEIHDDLLIDCLAAFDRPDAAAVPGLIELSRSDENISAETRQIQERLRKLHQGSTPIDENKSRPGDHGSESLDQILERPPRVDESQYEYARDFFINQVSLIALEMAMIRVRNSFPQIEPQLLALSPSDAGEAAAYRSSALEAWKRGTSAYMETGRHQFSGDGAGGA